MPIQSKHILNTSSSLVLDSLLGLCALNPHLALDSQNKVVYLESPDCSKVALICGGGSGHEPAHSGFVGHGILNAAICGNIFASPNASQVRRGIDLVENDKGTVIIVKNYTGDVLNFGLAKERYVATYPEKADRLRFVVVDDDVAVGRTQGNIVGRRGLAGTVLVYKIAGALAGRGASLDEVCEIATWVSSRIGTIGVGLEHCHVPGTAASASHLASTEIEIGMGIHNESGYERVSPVPPLKELIPQLLDLIMSTKDEERSFLPFEGGNRDNVVLLVNNLGGLSELELGSIVAQARDSLREKGVKIHRILSGSFMTSLNMPGFSITLFLLPPKSHSSNSSPKLDLLLSLLDEEADAPGWKWSSKLAPSQSLREETNVSTSLPQQQISSLHPSEPKEFTAAIERACKGLIAAEPEITKMDTIAGDGDCGLTLKSGAEAVLKKINTGSINGVDVINSIMTIAQVAEEDMGGTSGALYSIFFAALAQGFQIGQRSATVTHAMWEQALTLAITKLYSYTRARPPSRTLIDPLSAFVETLPLGVSEAVKAASEAAVATQDIAASVGRSVYVGDRLQKERVADPGAWGVKVILEHLMGINPV